MMVKKHVHPDNESGFSLLEVVASIVILSIILLSFFQLIIQSNVVAKHNTNKLVLINLADAELERLQAMTFTTKAELQSYVTSHTSQTLVDEDYDVSIEIQSTSNNINLTGVVMPEENDLSLYNVTVTVSETIDDKTSSSIAEGYVRIYEQ